MNALICIKHKTEIIPRRNIQKIVKNENRQEPMLGFGVLGHKTNNKIYIIRIDKMQHQDYFEEYLPCVILLSHEKGITMFMVVTTFASNTKSSFCIYVSIF